MIFRAYGLNINSDIHIPEFQQISVNNPDVDVTIRIKKIQLPKKAEIEGDSFKVHMGVIFRFWGHIGIFELHNGKKIYVDPAFDVDPNLLRRFLVGTVFAVLLYQRGLFILHASTVKIENSAIAFLGNFGLGKSTTAMAFYQAGHPIVTDDYVALNFDDNEFPLVEPGFPRLKLSYDFLSNNNPNDKTFHSNYSKNFINVDNGFPKNPIKLNRLFVLERGNDLLIEPIKRQEAFKVLLSNTFVNKLLNNSEKRKNLLYYSRIIQNIPIKRLVIPKSLNVLVDVVKLVENDIFGRY